MDAVILAGGFGKRLQDTVSDVPKPLAPIHGTPFLDILLDQLKGHCEQIILAVGYKAEHIKAYYQHTNILFSEENQPLGTGGALKQALHLIRTPSVLVLNGDSYFGVDIERLVAFHQEKQADLTLACKEVEDVCRYGSIFFNGSGRVSAFYEKELKEGKGWINGGMYLMKKALLEPFPEGSFSLEEDVFPHLLQARVFAYPSTKMFIDIGTKESYFKAQEIL